MTARSGAPSLSFSKTVENSFLPAITPPTWIGSYTYQGDTYYYTMIGTNPSAGSVKTQIPAVIIPLKFTFADGTILSATTAYPTCGLSKSSLALTQQSPLFHSYAFAPGGTKVGTTQYTDAFQRANFWNYISTTSSGYHVLLSPVTVKPVQPINVTATEGSTASGNCLLSKIGMVNRSFFDSVAQGLLSTLAIPSTSLAIFLSYDTVWTDNGTSCTSCYTGYHWLTPSSQTYAVATYLDPNYGGTADTASLSHELGEWMNDPFASNPAPGWQAGQATQCQFNVEAGDPVDGITFTAPLNGITYHLEDLTFLSWFAREGPATSVNGWYSFLNSFSSPPSVCQPYAVVHAFAGSDGADPYAGVVISSNGTVYGTTTSGNGPGNIFTISGNSFSVLHSFAGGNNGGTPSGGVVLGSDVNIYGTTTFGGTSGGGGTLFQMNTSGSSFTTIDSLNGNPDGAEPFSSLLEGTDGNLYGTTLLGGSGGQGTVFSVATNGSNFTVLFSFDGTHGAQPYAPLIQGTDGYLYGTTVGGGAYNAGVVFKISTAGGQPTILHSFNGTTDGGAPYGGLVQAYDGNLYGTTTSGGQGYGTIFRVDPYGVVFTALHTFDYSVEGGISFAGLAEDGDPLDLFGVTYTGGTGGNGSIFGINLLGNLTYIAPFGNSTNGAEARGTLAVAPNSTLYGTTQVGGLFGDGVVFQFGP